MKLFGVALIIVCLCSCEGKNAIPYDVLDKKKMADVMWDVLNVNSFTQQYVQKDSSKNAIAENVKLQQKVFEMHHVTREVYYKSYNFYASQPELMQNILDTIIARGEKGRIQMLQLQHGGKPNAVP